MCLVTKNTEQTAKEDITCYKVVFLEDNKLLSFYQGFEYILNNLYTTVISYTHDLIEEDYICIERAFHSYTSLDHAMKFLQVNEIYDATIVKCIIPKGAKFYQDYECFASSQIIIKQILWLY